MKAIRSMFAALGLAFVLPASAATSDPEVILYRFSGVRDDGGTSFSGVATAFHCTNFSGASENIRFVTRGNGGDLKQNSSAPISHLATKTAVTHSTRAYADDLNLGTGLVNQGSIAIAATSIFITCTAETINAADTVPVGVMRHPIRFNPIAGSQE
jgi:hypothetical protein